MKIQIKIKRIVALLLVAIMMLMLVGCGCDHDWKSATCTSPKVCIKCEEKSGNALGHSWKEATCTSLRTCEYCGETEGEMREHEFTDATVYQPETCHNCGLQRGEKLTPVREWGFNNLSEMGNALVTIYEYNLSDPENAYVVTKGNIKKFENGYQLRWGFKVENGKCIFRGTSDPMSYRIVNNDNIDLGNGWDELVINERKTLDSRENFVVLVERAGLLSSGSWYIPYSLIDWDRGARKKEGSEYEYILYLKND